MDEIKKKLIEEITEHDKLANASHNESIFWKFILILTTFVGSLLGVFAAYFSPEWLMIVIKIYITAVIPLITAVSILRSPDTVEQQNKKLSLSKQNILETIIAEELKPKSEQIPADDFFQKISTMHDISKNLS